MIVWFLNVLVELGYVADMKILTSVNRILVYYWTLDEGTWATIYNN